MSLYAFSTENWNRPKDEIRHLFKYLELFFKREKARMLREGCRIIVSGDITPLPASTKKTIIEAIEDTKECKQFTFNICLNYGGKAELVRAAKLFAQEVVDGTKKVEDLTEENFEQYLYTKDLPPVDLLIRTSGEVRISNFMLYSLSYSELVFTSTCFPDFDEKEFDKVLEDYYSRNITKGAVK